MARNTLIMGYILRKNKNAKSAAFNKWYAYVDNKGVLSTRGLAHHMVEHGLTNLADVLAMLAKLQECIPELVAQGYSVKLDGLGIFYSTIANEKGGAASPETFELAKNVKGVRFRFRADSTDLDNITTKAFGKKVSFGQGYYVTTKGKGAARIPLYFPATSDDDQG